MEDRNPPLDTVRAWSVGPAPAAPTHRDLMEHLRAYLAGAESADGLLQRLTLWDAAVAEAHDGLQASADACDQLSPATAEAVERGLLAMRAYRQELSSLRGLLVDGDAGGAAERQEPLQGLHMAVREAHEHLAAVSPPDPIQLFLSPQGARTENQWRLHLALQAYLNGRASLEKARVSVRWLAERFREAAAGADAEAHEGGRAAAETLRTAYQNGLETLARLDAALPSRDPGAVGQQWARLEDVFEQIRRGQGLCRELEEDGFDAWLDDD